MRSTFTTMRAAGALAVLSVLGGGLAAPAHAAVAPGHAAVAPGHAAVAPAHAAADELVPAAVAAPADPALREKADRIMNLTYRQFASTPHIPPFNWTTDGCSVPGGSLPYRKVFRPACVQHDFGYRNYGARHELKLDPTRETKNWIDGRFRTEMRRICDDTYTGARKNRECRNAAEVYYLGVQLGGDASFF
ncbi:phospholipase A2 [Streptomyces albus]|uniref:phospholipase A2 n=1 Tax=Streptomyces albus TaxID=1888 RepID=UPI0024AD2AED|nr:phospholipase A2 [Streptomyces albus]MDI6411516.1 phospholipase A2 [Streptomyces albus]